MSLFRAFARKSEARTVTAWGPAGWGGTSSSTVTEQTALNLSAVWACQTLIADQIATLPVDIYTTDSSGLRVEVEPPPWVHQPNPEMLAVDFETQRILSLLGWGNSFTLLVRLNGNHGDPLAPVVERWPIDPSTVQVSRSQGQLVYRINGTSVPTAAIQHITGYRLPGALVGMSVIEHAARGMGIATAAEEFGKTFFENGLAPSGVLEIPALPADVSAEVVDRLRDSVAERYGGSKNAGRPMALVGGTKWNQVSVDPAAAQFMETRNFETEEICRWYRVPPHEIQHITQHASQGGGQGLEQQSANLARKTLLPLTIKLEQADNRLLPRREFVKYNVDASIRADLKTRTEVQKLKIEAGMATPNQANAIEDNPPVPGGDAIRVPLNFAMFDEGQLIDSAKANTAGVLVRAGWEPDGVLAALGLPPIKHTGLVPVTVTPEEIPNGSVPTL